MSVVAVEDSDIHLGDAPSDEVVHGTVAGTARSPSCGTFLMV